MHKLSRIILALTLLFLLAAGVLWTSEQANAGQTATVITASLNARSGPGTEYAKVGALGRGTSLAIIAKNQNWYKVVLPNGKQAWVSGQYIKISTSGVTSTPKQTGKTAEVTGSLVNIRSGPGTGYKIVVQVRRGDKLPVISEGNGWLNVKLANGKTGWISASLVKVHNVQTQPSTGAETVAVNPPVKDTAGASQAGSNRRLVVVTASTANIRRGPSTGFDVVTQAAQGAEFEIANEQDGWYEVRLPNAQGWIAGWLVEPKNTPLSSRGGTTGSVIIDQEPGNNGNVPLDGDTQQGTSPSQTGQAPSQGGSEPTGGTDLPAAGGATSGTEAQATIEGVRVEKNDGEVSIVLQATAPVVYSFFALSNPERLVVDVKGATLKTPDGGYVTVVDHGGVSQVRLGQFTSDTVRMVAEVNQPVQSRTTASQDMTSFTLMVSVAPSTTSPLKGRVIVIDPGHGSIQPGGWTDPGAVGPTNLYERDVVLDIAFKVGDILTGLGAKVIYTRTGDTTLDLAGRAQIANNIGADIFVSIHANASYSPSLSGTATYFYGGGALVAQRDKRERLARTVQMELVRALGRRDAGIFEENFSVLRNTLVPSILVETAFISNPEEEKLLADPQFRTKAAEGIARGITSYFSAN
ncbi:MAG: N-acetylmuramoyl-L-alanine amidase [Bacillota bacterium]